MKMPELQPVVSSNVMAIGYDPEGLLLYVKYKSGSVYAYSGVTPEVFQELQSAPSIGSHIAGIKKIYPCVVLGD